MKGQLEIYKIVLTGKDEDNFGRFVNDKYGPIEGKESKDIFSKMFKFLISEFDKKVWTSKSNEVGLSVLTQEKIENVLTPNTKSFVIDGFIDGGHYNMLRKLTNLSDTSDTTNIGTNNMVTDRFYVYLYINPEESIGILMIERKGQMSISAAMSKFIQDFFRINKSRSCKVMRYYPTYLIEDFKKGAIVDSITCSDQFVKQVYGTNNLVVRNASYNVSVKITPLNEEDKQADKSHILDQIKTMLFSLSGTNETVVNLSEFSKKKGCLKHDNGKTCLFEIDKEDVIKPIIPIEENFYSPIEGHLKKDMIMPFCNDILDNIKSDVYAIIR